LTPTFSTANIRSFPFPFYLLLILLSIVVFLPKRGKVRVAPILILPVCFLLSLTGNRNMAIFAAAAAPLTIQGFQDWKWSFSPNWARVLSVVLLFLLLLQSVRWSSNLQYREEGLSRRFGLGILDLSYPKGVVEFIQRYKPAGNLGHFDPYGGYYMYFLNSESYRPFLDGRWEIYDQNLIYGLYSALSHPSSYFEMIDPYHINLYVVDYKRKFNRRLLVYLDRSPEWVLLYFDQNSALFVRNIPQNRGLIQKTQFDLSGRIDALEVNRRSFENQIPQSVMNLMVYLGKQNEAMKIAERILEKIPGEPRTTELLVNNLVKKGRLSEAKDRIDAALSHDGNLPALLSQKAFILYTERKIPEAIEAMRRVIKLRPKSSGDHYNLALLYVQAGELDRAAREASEVERLEPGYKGLSLLKRRIRSGRNYLPDSG